jgi:hypothetical protein
MGGTIARKMQARESSPALQSATPALQSASRRDLAQALPIAALIGAVFALFVLAVILLWNEGNLLYRTREYRGEGTITDHGFWSYPRYRIAMPEMLLTEAQEHSFTLQGLPTADFTFKLEVLSLSVQGRDVSSEDFDTFRKDLMDLPVDIAVTITDGQGKTIYAGSAPIQNWELEQSVTQSSLWLEDLRDMKLKRGQRYRLHVDLRGRSADDTRVIVKPHLKGGGSEAAQELST